MEKLTQSVHITCIASVALDGKSYPPFTIVKTPRGQKEDFIFPDVLGKVILNGSGWVSQEVKLEFFEWLLPQLLDLIGNLVRPGDVQPADRLGLDRHAAMIRA